MVPIVACSIEGCASVALCRGWCKKHYERWRKNGDPMVGGKVIPTECKEAGCSRMTVGQGWCDTHYCRFVKAPKRKQAVIEANAGRFCAHCGVPLPAEKNARASFCSRACKIAARIASGAQAQAALASYYKRQYGLTLEQVQTMRCAGCAICGRANGGGRHGQLHIDHDHATGRVRGALCDSCNNGLGKFRDSPDLLRAAAAYLEQRLPV